MDLLGDDDVHGSLPRFSDEPLSISLQISSGEGHPSRQQLIPGMPPPPPPPPPPPRNMLFYKTRLCGKFSWGFCPYGSNCCFAHGPQDLRNPPPNWQEIVAVEQTLGMNWNQHRTQYHNGEEGLQPMPNPFESNHSETLQVLSSSGGDGFGSHQRVGPWKPKLCHKWEATGHCPYGATCLFAHGYAELKKFGGHLELSRTKVRAAPSKTLLDPSNNDSPSKTEPACKHQTNKKSFLKWKDPKKISRIYADWIDDIPLFTHTSLTKASR